LDIPAVVALLRTRAALRAHERLTRAELLSYQAGRLQELRSFALDHSPFYRSLHRGLQDRPLGELPVVTKALLMERFDDLVTDRAVRLADVRRHAGSAAAADLFLHRYRVAGTAGTTGMRAFFLYDPDEWTAILASYSRAEDWAGVRAGLGHRPRIAVVSTLNPTHQSAIVGATVASRFIPTLRLDAAGPLPATVAALDSFHPEVLVGYASVLAELAEEQLAGRLTIAPKAVMSASEVLAADTRARLLTAFGVEPFDVYAATETAGIASECEFHRLHLYEDLVIPEIVDDEGMPVPVGTTGARLLVTVLFSRTQPLIRYELSDRVSASADTCPCGRPFALLSGVEGRREDILHMAAVGGGSTAVHPNLFHAVLESFDVDGWQVVQDGNRITVSLVSDRSRADPGAVGEEVRRALLGVGVAAPAVQVRFVPAVARTELGKAPLIRATTAG
jgi:putative adenylate-forming enzyme